jgi:toxin ParE1/3/4
LAIFAILIAKPHPPEARDLPGAPGVRAYPMRLGRRLSDPGHRVGQPRHIVIYRIAADGVVEVLGVAHDRMRLAGAVRRMRREAGR